MKSILLFSLGLFLMTSCGTSSFDKQKYTSLRKVDESSRGTHMLSPIKPDVSAADKNQDGGANEDLIKMGIENNTLFILQQKDGYYKCNDIKYDGVYKTISTRLEKIELSDFQEYERIELKVNKGIEYNAVDSKIALTDLASSTYVKGEKKIIKTEETPTVNPNCQDVIYLKNGDSLLAKIDYTSKDNVYYYPCSGDQKTVLVKSKSEVARLYYHEGGDNLQKHSEVDNPSDHISKDETSCGDVIILNSGLEIQVRIIQIGNSGVSYKKNSGGRTFIKKKEYISKIKFSDGHEYEIKNDVSEQQNIESEKEKTKRAARGAGVVILAVLVGAILLFASLIALLNAF